jgi:polyisoprenoid-binding protein YceI
MTSKLFQRIGVLALIALVGGSFAALAVVRSRLHVTVAEEEAAAVRGPDPITLLASDVAAAREDVRALGDGVGTRLQLLHDTLATAASERDARITDELAALRREVKVLQERLDRDAPRADAALARSGPETEAAAAPAAGVAPPELAPETPRSGAPDAVAVTPAPAEPAPKRSFLSFKLPAQGFAFDQRQRFAIVPKLSRVGFDAKSTLHDFSGVTTAVAGELTTNPARPAEACSGTVSAQASTLDTGVDARDESMQELLEPQRFPELRFDWTGFDASSVDATAQRVGGIARGRLTIHGTAHDVAMPVNVSVDASKRLAIEGQTKIKLSAYGVRPPSKLGVISVEDEITLWVALRARPLGAAPASTP